METKAAKDEQSVNIQFTRDSKTSVQVDNVEEKKIQEHFDFVASRLQKLHKNVMWNMYVGRSFLEKIEPVTRVQMRLILLLLIIVSFVSTKLLLGAKTVLTILRICSECMRTLVMVLCACSVLLRTHLSVILIMMR